jgi:hypothetical protein
VRVANNVITSFPDRHGLRHLMLRALAVVGSCVLLGALDSRSPSIALGIVLLAALLWLALARPATAFVVVVAWMALPFIWTPSPGGHFLVPAEVGGIIFLVTGVIRKRWFRVNAIDYIVMAYVLTSILSMIANSESVALVQNNLQALVVPYVGWRMLFSSSSRARRLVAPCLLGVGTAVATAGIIELLIGSNPFIHIFVNPQLASWAQTYTRVGLVRISSSFGQPIALGTFLLIPIGLALAAAGRLRLVLLAILLPAEIFTLSRGAWLGTILLVLLMVPLFTKTARKGSLVAGFALVVACVILFAHPISTVLSSSLQQGTPENTNATYRANLLSTSVTNARLLGNPYTAGNGGSLYGQAGFVDVASWYALTLGETGWLGLISLLALAGAASAALRRGYKQHSVPLVALAAVTLAQMAALTSAPPITNYRDFLWLTVACLATWFSASDTEPQARQDGTVLCDHSSLSPFPHKVPVAI